MYNPKTTENKSKIQKIKNLENIILNLLFPYSSDNSYKYFEFIDMSKVFDFGILIPEIIYVREFTLCDFFSKT